VTQRVALVTGGASGIGAETSRVYAREGAKVAIADVNDNAGRGVASEIGDGALYAHLDTRSEGEWQAVVKQVVHTYGRLDILVNAAGVSGRRSDGTSATNIEEQDLEDWNRVMDVNSTGIFLGMKTVIPEMRKAGGGSIINITSIAAERGGSNNPAYAAAKGGLKQMTKALASDLAPFGIRVNNIGPGYFRTDMTNYSWDDPERRAMRTQSTMLGRWGMPADLAGIAVLLASDASSYITGQDFYVDGGWLAKI